LQEASMAPQIAGSEHGTANCQILPKRVSADSFAQGTCQYGTAPHNHSLYITGSSRTETMWSDHLFNSQSTLNGNLF
jgi:hypothetical protein